MLVRHLLRDGQRVRVLTRRRPTVGLLPLGIELVEGEVTDRAAVRRAVGGVDCIYHLAAKLHITAPTPDLRDEYRRVNVDGTRRVAEEADAAQVRRLMQFSTINVYGPSRFGRIHDERSPLNPDSWYAETKAEAEEVALRTTSAVVLRLAAVYGACMKGNYPRLVEAVRRRRFVRIGGENRRTLVHVDDVCAAAMLAARHPDAAGEVLNVTDGEIHTMNDIVAAICEALEQPRPRVRIPAAAAWIAAAAVRGCCAMAGRPAPIGPSAIRKLVEDIAVDGTWLQWRLGFVPRYSLWEGWRQALGGEAEVLPFQPHHQFAHAAAA